MPLFDSLKKLVVMGSMTYITRRNLTLLGTLKLSICKCESSLYLVFVSVSVSHVLAHM